VRVARKYNLERIGHRYESIEIEVEGDDISDIIKRIEEAWRVYCRAIVEGAVQ